MHRTLTPLLLVLAGCQAAPPRTAAEPRAPVVASGLHQVVVRTDKLE